ncbi:amidohydrolase family protein [Bradyrhizobium sp. AUGA SZCCT0177]|uniref:amidohydrolase family protein n=1 Tax=Bradyrhizobium sp. AUGA SZCCT0177 TaxID=2807665 RepID=UPI001BA6A5DF|nr:amidohydrolase family protein [Bradyrhizobium sp. AUGA SZCCT0177]MBR1282682.1 amidohydrolase family protein [Bradyrhizobium sp. AUGA SZCCT0177]
MKIIDAQVHIWSQTVTPTSGLHRKVAKFAAEEVLAEMDEAGVDAALIHPPAGWDPDSNALAIEAVRKYPDRFAIMGNFPLENPDNRKLIHGWRQQSGMIGLRWPLLLEAHQKWLYDGSLDWLWPAAEQEGLPLAMMGGLFLPKFREIAERHPGLKMILDHCGLNRHGRDAAAFVHLDELLALAQLPNVAVKATGAPHYSTESYPFRNIHDGLHRIFDAYGPKRMFWGTDITRMPCSYRQCVTFFTEELPWLKGADLEDVMGRALCDWIGWDYASVRG